MSRKYNHKWLDISDALTPKAMAEFKTGQVLKFMQNGEKRTYRITRMTKTKCWVTPIETFTADELRAQGTVETS
ncbi:hypothetical protein [Pedococcus soli]